ncbi:MAG: PilT/PilU family type 4a pilus ATPase [Synechococcaceae cyanobacterium]|nr:PilT/PilU family type 4a pilus ATPase [Synechococcaceae cyanobacterium]
MEPNSSVNAPPLPPPLPDFPQPQTEQRPLSNTAPDLPKIPGIPEIPAPVPQRRPASAADPLAGLPEQQPGSLTEIVRQAYELLCSDVHVGVGEKPRFRFCGDMLATDWPVTDEITFRTWMRELLSPHEIDLFRRDKEFDGARSFEFARVRINVLDSLRGGAMVLRLIPHEITSLQDLNLPMVLQDLARRPKGLFLVTGPTGSGKSTTLAAMIDYINSELPKHIITIEDPVEFVHSSRRCLIRHRELGTHTRDFHQALRAAMREDPDIMLIGEIRDRVTLSTALEAAQTGHLVFGTLHTNSAIRSVERILGMYPPEDQGSVRRAVAESLLGVISQGLIKTTDGKRAAYWDLFINTDACRDYIINADLDAIEEIMERSGFDGMVTTNQSLLKLIEEGRATGEEALKHSPKPSELAQSLRGRV